MGIGGRGAGVGGRGAHRRGGMGRRKRGAGGRGDGRGRQGHLSVVGGARRSRKWCSPVGVGARGLVGRLGCWVQVMDI
jgi:hypothetical protein